MPARRARTCLQGYVEAAQVFEAESATAPGVDLGAITDRMEIRKAVQSGNMEEAIERVNDLNPQVSSKASELVSSRIGENCRSFCSPARRSPWRQRPVVC